MATMNINVPPEIADFVEKEVAQGGYGSSSEVVGEALRLLRHQKAQEQEKLTILRREVEFGIAAAEEGRFSAKTVGDILDDVLRDAAVR